MHQNGASGPTDEDTGSEGEEAAAVDIADQQPSEPSEGSNQKQERKPPGATSQQQQTSSERVSDESSRSSPARPPAPSSRLSSMQDMSFSELLHTEAEYVADLRTMCRVYARPAQKLSILSSAEKNAIFSNTEQLLMTAEALLDELKKEGPMEAVWADAFLKTAPYFKIYADYCKNYLAALSTVHKCRQDCDGFAEFLTSQSCRAECKNLPLESFLIKPVQRLLKYPLFFRQILDSLPSGHPHRERLEKAEKLVLAVSTAVNNSQSDGTSMFQALVCGLGQDYLKLLAPHRKLKMRFTCAVTCTVNSFAAMVFLTTDLLLICERGTDRSGAASLRPWLLAPLKGLLTGDEALDGDRGQLAASLVSQPVSDFIIACRLEGWSTSGQDQWSAAEGTPSGRQQFPQFPGGSPVGGSEGSGGGRASSWGSGGRASCGSGRLRADSSSLGGSVGSPVPGGGGGPGGGLGGGPGGGGRPSHVDEVFRLELPSAEAQREVQATLDELLRAVDALEAEARRPDRRLKSVRLDDAAKELIQALAQSRHDAEAAALSEREKQATSKPLRSDSSGGGSGRLSQLLGFGSKRASTSKASIAKDDLRRQLSQKDGQGGLGVDEASPESSRGRERQSSRFAAGSAPIWSNLGDGTPGRPSMLRRSLTGTSGDSIISRASRLSVSDSASGSVSSAGHNEPKPAEDPDGNRSWERY
jgi:hypothetical protein